MKCYRGLAYFQARKLIDKNEKVKAVFRAELGVCYDTVCRYIMFAALSKTDNLWTVLTLKLQNNRNACWITLNVKLSDMIRYPNHSVSAQEKAVEIQPADKISFSIDPKVDSSPSATGIQ